MLGQSIRFYTSQKKAVMVEVENEGRKARLAFAAWAGKNRLSTCMSSKEKP